MLYHKEQGFDRFLYYDDKSEDDSVKSARTIAGLYGIDLTIEKTDDEGPTHDFASTQDSNSYSGSKLDNRIVRSYSSAVRTLKEEEGDAYVAFIDPDEFIVGDNDTTVAEIVDSYGANHIYPQSFDIMDGFDTSGFYPMDDKALYRWSFEGRACSVYRGRGKSIARLSSLPDTFAQLPGVVHTLFSDNKEGKVPDDAVWPEPGKLRIHHFRIPCGDPNIEFIKDDTLYKKFTAIKKKWFD